MAKGFIAGHQAPEATGPCLWFIFMGERLLVRSQGEDRAAFPLVEHPGELGLTPSTQLYLGVYQGTHCRTAAVAPETPAPEGYKWKHQRALFPRVEPELYFVVGAARQVLAWDVNNRFCGACGALMGDRKEERAKQCPSCGLIRYPRLSPAVIMRVEKEGKILLGRSPRFPEGMYSVLAGFVEPGENLEETVTREVWEEAKIKIKNPRYFGSQPWALPDSLMIGFIAEYAGGDLAPDRVELEDAGWFGPEEMPKIPGKGTIARALIDDFLEPYNH